MMRRRRRRRRRYMMFYFYVVYSLQSRSQIKFYSSETVWSLKLAYPCVIQHKEIVSETKVMRSIRHNYSKVFFCAECCLVSLVRIPVDRSELVNNIVFYMSLPWVSRPSVRSLHSIVVLCKV